MVCEELPARLKVRDLSVHDLLCPDVPAKRVPFVVATEVLVSVLVHESITTTIATNNKSMRNSFILLLLVTRQKYTKRSNNNSVKSLVLGDFKKKIKEVYQIGNSAYTKF